MYNFVRLTTMKNTYNRFVPFNNIEIIFRFLDTLLKISKFRKKQFQPIPVKK